MLDDNNDDVNFDKLISPFKVNNNDNNNNINNKKLMAKNSDLLNASFDLINFNDSNNSINENHHNQLQEQEQNIDVDLDDLLEVGNETNDSEEFW